MVLLDGERVQIPLDRALWVAVRVDRRAAQDRRPVVAALRALRDEEGGILRVGRVVTISTWMVAPGGAATYTSWCLFCLTWSRITPATYGRHGAAVAALIAVAVAALVAVAVAAAVAAVAVLVLVAVPVAVLVLVLVAVAVPVAAAVAVLAAVEVAAPGVVVGDVPVVVGRAATVAV